MIYRVLGDAVVLVHFAFVPFVVLGGLLVRRWRRIAWGHVPYLAAILYPAGLTRGMQVALGAFALAVNILIYAGHPSTRPERACGRL